MVTNTQTLSRLDEYQKLYDDLFKKMERLKSFEKSFKKISKKIHQLDAYYLDKWIDDVEEIKDKKEAGNYTILNEDSIWNLLSEHYEFNKKMLKVLAVELNK